MARFSSTIFVLLFIFSQLWGQNTSTPVNRADNQGKRTGVWELYYDNGALKETGHYEAGEKTGLWKTYYNHGTIKHEITYTDGLAKGLARFYYRDGTIWEEGFWNENHWKGEYNLYHANGEKFYEWHYDDSGKRTGEQKYFFANGQLQYSGKWQNGNIEGEVNVYSEEGDLIEKREYADGEFSKTTVITRRPENQQKDPSRKILPFYGTGHYTLQSLDGLVIKEGYFRDGVLQDGKHFIYNKQDSLIQLRIVENGKSKTP
jgi:antitoxin component YwqK of YwqJK toxin-antitoxin module